jgi:hypothetical protein
MSGPLATQPVWERQPCEPEAEWRAFLTYRDMPRPRSFRLVSGYLGLAQSRISSWAYAWMWKDRANLYDRQAFAAEWQEHAAKQAARKEESEALIDKATQLAYRELAHRLEDIDPSTGRPLAPLKDAQLVRLVESVIKLDRLVHGESTEKIETTGSVDLKKLSDDELAQYMALLDKAKKGDE